MTTIWRNAVTPVLTAVRTHWRPFVLIQVAAITVAVLYYLLPGFQQWAAGLAKIKENGGLLFAGCSTAFAAVALPELAKRVFARGPRKIDWTDFGFQACLFAFMGITVDLFYGGLGVWLGTAHSAKIVVEKVLVDQLLYSPLFSMAFCTLVFLWKDSRYRVKPTLVFIHDGTFTRNYVGNMVACWLFWIPALAAIYAMPVDLQFCLYLCIEAAWALLLLTMAGRE